MIEILKNEKDFIDLHSKHHDKDIGFVPTMGNLHRGHLSLLEQSLKDNEVSILSIYVNPTQFGENDDLDAYPRTFEQDLLLIKDIKEQYQDKEIFIFYPENNEVIYPKDFDQFISVPELNKIIEGEVRPTHFDGVATVVYRLFQIVKPHRAYFGKKDYQQFRLVQKLVESKQLDVKIVGLPIVREDDGLAMSSRNHYLDHKQRKEALKLNRTLNEVVQTLQSKGISHAMQLIDELKKQDKRFNYIEVRKQTNLGFAEPDDKELVVLGNFQIGTTRLLDNIEVNL